MQVEVMWTEIIKRLRKNCFGCADFLNVDHLNFMDLLDNKREDIHWFSAVSRVLET